MMTTTRRAACGGIRRPSKVFPCHLQPQPLFHDHTLVSRVPAGGNLAVCAVCLLGRAGAALGRAGALLGGRELLLVEEALRG